MLEAFELYLTDRAAQMDGATRLQMAARLMPDEDSAPIITYIDEAATIRRGVIQRGAADLDSISDDEWERLTNG
jgi:hypothetical protein